jgi:hypothetical protein
VGEAWSRQRRQQDLIVEMQKDLDASTIESLAWLDDLVVVEHVFNMARVSRSAPPQVANNDVSMYFVFIPQTLPKKFKIFLLKHFLKRFLDKFFKNILSSTKYF